LSQSPEGGPRFGAGAALGGHCHGLLHSKGKTAAEIARLLEKEKD
jgi:hypothetical protein